MPTDEPLTNTSSIDRQRSEQPQQAPQKRSRFDDLFSIPPSVKRIFDNFPLFTCEANELPVRAPRNREDNVLHVFTTIEDARTGKPSFNPACLKWQAYLRFADVQFRTVSSNNHASPSGALPFLIPAASTAGSGRAPDPVPSNKLKRWLAAQKQGKKLQEPEDVRYEAYTSLLDGRLRKAWLHQLYLTPANYPLLHRLYIAPCSSNPLVQLAIVHQVRSAAETELVKASASSTIVEEEVYRDASEAFEALSSLLTNQDWALGQRKPGLLDASIFAYTQLILDDGLGWSENRLADMLRTHETLVRHQDRVAKMYF